VRAISLHRDVLVVTSALLQLNCVIVRAEPPGEGSSTATAECFVIDSPVLPEELDALAAVVEQAGFPRPVGLLATHGDWDHLLGCLAYPELPLGCAASTVERLRERPGETQRELRAFDEQLLIERPQPLGLGTAQALPVPGRCELGGRDLELHPTSGHTADGMAIAIPWAGVLVVGDYLSPVEIPTIAAGGSVDAYLETLERLRGPIEQAAHVVPGHGAVLDGERAGAVLTEDLDYIRSTRERGLEAHLPASRRRPSQRRLHHENVNRLTGDR
jgi:glyoxylase-like metal-dependent hydrolase (beta-lactamase superfamily II)